MTLTAKEQSLLKDMKDSEQLCIDKYTRGASTAHDGQLKNLFSTLVENERTHLDMLSKIEQGSVPTMPSGGASFPTFSATYASGTESQNAKDDAYLCQDALSGEKQVSSLYNTCIFEFTDNGVRGVLADIEKAEQNHGKMIYDYMKANGMYS